MTRMIFQLIASKNQVNLEINVFSLAARSQMVAKIVIHLIARNNQVRLNINVSKLMIVMTSDSDKNAFSCFYEKNEVNFGTHIPTFIK